MQLSIYLMPDQKGPTGTMSPLPGDAEENVAPRESGPLRRPNVLNPLQVEV